MESELKARAVKEEVAIDLNQRSDGLEEQYAEENSI